MRKTFIGSFIPKQEEFDKLWNDGIFIVDTNVLLHLYRYSPEPKAELEEALESLEDKLFITHQSAKEFLKKRLSVTAKQANEYTSTIKDIEKIVEKLSTKNKHPFISSTDLDELEIYTKKLIKTLEEQKEFLENTFSEDKNLDFIERIFMNKTGIAYPDEDLAKILDNGEERYNKKTPPGYEDAKKTEENDPCRRFGDLIIWMQMIDHAKTEKKPIIFISDDKKKDWWLEESGKRISPRPELIEEFYKETQQNFWMYDAERFLQYTANLTKRPIAPEVIQEISQVSKELTNNKFPQTSEEDSDISYENFLESMGFKFPSISVSKDIISKGDDTESGVLVVTLHKPMKYVTGTGKFDTQFDIAPMFSIRLIESPYEVDEDINITYGCGTTTAFHVHIKSKFKLLEVGDYIFRYTADALNMKYN